MHSRTNFHLYTMYFIWCIHVCATCDTGPWFLKSAPPPCTPLLKLARLGSILPLIPIWSKNHLTCPKTKKNPTLFEFKRTEGRRKALFE